MAPPKDIARSYPKRGLTADVGFRSEPKFCGDGAATFPTLSDYAQTAASADLALGETYTLCAWVRHVKPVGANHAVNIGVSGTIKVSISFFGGVSNPEVYCYNGVTSMNTTGVFNSAAHTWYHIAMVIKPGAGNSQIFINGIDRTASHSQSFPLSGSPVLHIGGDYSASNGDWEGDLANVALFTSSLTEDQVRQAMRASDYGSHAAIATLEAFYPLSSDFNDSTGNHNATASGSPEFRPNRPQLPRGLDLARGAAMARVYTGRALDQDGSVDRLQGTNFTDATATACTVSFWMYQRDGGSGRIIHNFGGGATAVDRFIASMHSGNLNIAGEITSGNRLGFTIPSLPLNQWHHVAFVLDGNGTTSLNTTILYLNGEKYDSPVAVGIIWDSTTFDIGGTVHGYQNQLIAGVKVFNMKFTDAQARELYHNPEQVLPAGVSASNLRRYYPLSDYNDTGGTGGRYFQDIGADGEPLEDIGSSSMDFAQPVPCPQLGLQQSATRLFVRSASGDKATVTLPSAPGSSFSFQIWVNMKTVGFGFVLEYGDTSVAGEGLAIRISSGQVTTYDAGASALFSGLSVSEGEWAHIVMATSDSSPYWRCWVNGTEASSPQALTGTRTGASTSLMIARSPAYGSTPDCIISNCAFWTTQLDAPDVAALYNSGDQNVDVSTVQSSSLVGWWKCDDFTKFKNYANPGTADATVTGSPIGVSFPENASGSTIVGDFSMKRKGVSVLNPTSTPAGAFVQSAIISNDGSLSPDPAKGGYSFSAFIRFEQASGANPWFPMIFGATNYLNVSQRFILNFGNNSVAANPPGLSITDGSAQRDYDWPSPVSNPEEWHQLAFTIDYTTSPNTTFRLYLDGALVSTQATHPHSAFDPGDIIVGSYTSPNGNFPGAIACFKMYQTKLSDNEIEQIYRSDLRLIKGLENE